MNFNKYHVSKNLFDLTDYSSYITGISDIVTTSNSITYTATSTFLAIRYFFPLNTTDIFTIQLGSESSKVRLELRYRKNGETVGNAIVVTIGDSYVIRGSEDVDEIQINISNGTNTGTCKASNIMLNTGSTPQPYEPYASEVWHDIPHYIHNTSTDTITTLPAVIYPTGTTATVGLKGQTTQSSIPSPTSPVMPQGTGERTGNLLPLSDKTFTITAYGSNLTVTCSGGNLYFSGTVTEIPSNYTAWKTNFAFELEAGTYYCNNPSPLGSGFGRYVKKYSDDTNISTPSDYTFTLSETTKLYLAFYIYDKSLDNQVKLMLNLGSTALPYEPYGYFIEIEVS